MNYSKYVASVKSWNWPEDWLLKLISLLFAVFLWYFVVGEDKVDLNVLIPIEIVNLPRDLVVSNQYKKELDVTLSGARGLIRGLSRQNVRRTVDLSGAEPGTTVIHNTPDTISLPRGIRVMRIQPTNVVLLIDRLIQKTIGIKPVVEGKTPDGFQLDSVTVKPDSIMITGPQALFADTHNLFTDTIDISTITASQERQVSLDLSPGIAELLGETMVTVRVAITKRLEKKTVPEVTITLTDQDENYGYYWEPSTVTVLADIPTTMLQKDTNVVEYFTAEADVSNLVPGRHTLAVAIKASPGILVHEITPQKLQVDISRMISPTRMKIDR